MRPLPSTHHAQLVRKIAAIAHYGGLIKLDEHEALVLIRGMTREYTPQGTEEEQHKAVMYATTGEY